MPVRIAEDCAGLAPGAYILDQLGAPYVLEWASEKNSKLHEFLGHKARHIFPDISKRVFQPGRIASHELNGEVVIIDTRSTPIDLYLAGVSCRPFSSKGSRLGLRHPEFKTLLFALRTMQALEPRAGLLENVLSMLHEPFWPQVQELFNLLGGYTWRTFRANSAEFGLPQQRQRVYILFVRKDLAPPDSKIFDRVGATVDEIRLRLGPARPLLEYLDMCGDPVHANTMEEKPPICHGCSPLTVCASHPCRCKLCSLKGKPSTKCKWRLDCHSLMQSKRFRKVQAAYYAQCKGVLDKLGKKVLPSYFEFARHHRLTSSRILRSPRQRCLLMILSQMCNLMSSNVVVDLSQSASRLPLRTDGLCMTLTCSSAHVFIPSRAWFLSASQCLLLQGIDPSKVCAGLTDTELRRLAGNAFSMPVAASFIVGALKELGVASET